MASGRQRRGTHSVRENGEATGETATRPDALFVKLEKLVAEIHSELDPTAVVRHNVMLPGYESGTQRQIDVLIEPAAGPFHLKIIVDTKDHARPVDVKGVEAFIGMKDDVRAHQGSMVCPKGFTRAAKARAEKANVALFTLVDTENHKWQTGEISLPAICEFREASATVGMALQVSDPTQFAVVKMPLENPEGVALLDEARRPLGTMIEATTARWNQGEFPSEVGDHTDLDVFPDQSVFWDNGDGTVTRAYIRASLTVTGAKFFGNVPLVKVRGLRNAQTGALHINAFATGLVSPDEVISKWLRIDEATTPIPEHALSFLGFARMAAKPAETA